jgi:hypothetical protein
MERQSSVSDVTINSVTLQSASFFGGAPYNLVPHIREINIYESLFSNALTANITLDESINLPEKFPIVGEERVMFDISIPGMTQKFDDGTSLANELPMYVHKTSNRKLTAPQSQALSLELVSTAYMKNIHSRISKAYCDKKPNQIAWDIYTKYLHLARWTSGIFEPCFKLEQCVIPNWSPYKALNWLAGRATSFKNPECANYVFYETMSGSHFRSIDSMIVKDSMLLLSMEPAATDPHKVEYLANQVVKCDSIDLVHQPEMVKNINRGCYASKLITHDIVTKKITQHSYDLFKSWKKTAHLNKIPPVLFAPREITNINSVSFGPLSDKDKNNKAYGSSLNNFHDSVVLFSPKHNQMYANNPGHEYDNEVENWRLQRNSQMTLFDGTKFYVQMGGLPLLRVGMCVDIHMMSPEAYRKHEHSEDEVLSGKCMITALKHTITQIGGNQEYKMVLELCKDGMGK